MWTGMSTRACRYAATGARLKVCRIIVCYSISYQQKQKEEEEGENDLILIWVTLLSQTWIRTCGARCKSSGSILSHIMNEWMYVCMYVCMYYQQIFRIDKYYREFIPDGTPASRKIQDFGRFFCLRFFAFDRQSESKHKYIHTYIHSYVLSNPTSI